MHMTEYLDEQLAAGNTDPGEADRRPRATFHDPCQIVRRGGLEAAARRVVAALGFCISSN
jgi:Fe-S oxidoreductase